MACVVDGFVDETAVYWYESQATAADGGIVARVSKVAVGGGPTVVLFEGCFVGGGDMMVANSTTLYVDCRQQVDTTKQIEIMQIPKDPSVAPTPFLISDTSIANCVETGQCDTANVGVADDSNVYFQILNGGGPIFKMAVGGGPLAKVTPVPGDADYGANATDIIWNMTVIGGTLYYLAGDVPNQTRGLWSVPTSGGAPNLLGSGDPFSGQVIGGFVQLNGYLYWRYDSGGLGSSVAKVPMTGGTPTKIGGPYSFTNSYQQLALFGNALYFAGQFDGWLRIEALPVDQTDGGATTVVQDFPSLADYPAAGNAQLVVANKSHLFFADPGFPDGGKIYRCD